MLRSDALDGIGDQLARAAIALDLGLLFDLADDPHHVRPRVFLHLGQQLGPRFLQAHAGDPLQLPDLLGVQFVQLIGALVERALTLAQRLVALLDLVHAPVKLRAAAVLPLLFSGDLRAPA